jgi:hypothetical protein
MGVGDWISIFMALIATASAIVTYSVFRSSTDPLIIVYAEPDLKRPSVVNLIIKNIGKGAAHSVQFIPNRVLPYNAFGIEVPTDMPKEMKSGPIVTGIPFLAPDQQIILTWGQYGGLYKFIGESPIEIESIFNAVGRPHFLSRKLRSKSILDIKMFEQSQSSEYGFGPNIVKELKEIREVISSIVKS